MLALPAPGTVPQPLTVSSAGAFLAVSAKKDRLGVAVYRTADNTIATAEVVDDAAFTRLGVILNHASDCGTVPLTIIIPSHLPDALVEALTKATAANNTKNAAESGTVAAAPMELAHARNAEFAFRAAVKRTLLLQLPGMAAQDLTKGQRRRQLSAHIDFEAIQAVRALGTRL